MFDHVVFGVGGYATSDALYLKALEPIGMAVVAEGPLGIEMSTDGRCSLCLFPTEEKPAHLHLAFIAKKPPAGRGLHRAVLEAGARDNGAPGQRPNDSSRYYTAFVIDPDGHNIEVVCHETEG